MINLTESATVTYEQGIYSLVRTSSGVKLIPIFGSKFFGFL